MGGPESFKRRAVPQGRLPTTQDVNPGESQTNGKPGGRVYAERALAGRDLPTTSPIGHRD